MQVEVENLKKKSWSNTFSRLFLCSSTARRTQDIKLLINLALNNDSVPNKIQLSINEIWFLSFNFNLIFQYCSPMMDFADIKIMLTATNPIKISSYFYLYVRVHMWTIHPTPSFFLSLAGVQHPQILGREFIINMKKSCCMHQGSTD